VFPLIAFVLSPHSWRSATGQLPH